jgi:hypothetical protein
MYNGDLNDESDGGKLGYGDNPPAIGCDFFEGPYQDADGIDNPGPYFDNASQTLVVPTVVDAIANNGIVYKGIGIGYSDGIVDNERFGMRRFTYYTSTSAYPYNDPGPAAEFYNFMEGQWANGSEMYYGGLGSTPGTLSDYMFPGTSDPLHWSTAGQDMSAQYPNGWDESTNNNPPGDRRFVQSAGPFTLKPGAVNNITVGIVYGRSTEGSLMASVEAMKRADTKAQALFDACFKILSPPDAPKLTIQELDRELILMIENPISSNNYQEGYEEIDEINIPDPTVDRKYRFEGYQIFQLKNQDVSVADIADPTKARLVAQCDIKNNISRLINFEFDEALGFAVPSEKVDGENKGIRHSFQIQEDAFAQGARRLVNHKTYYYVAVAYAHNEFKKYDPNDPLFLDGQKIPYISSRLNFDGTAISSTPAVPHNPMPEADGTNQLADYGSTPRITRLDGYGNGNRSLEFTESTLSTVLSDGYTDTPEYEYGQGPVNIKVVDPLNLKGGYFECRFKDYVATSPGNAADTAGWVIYRYDKKGGTVLDSVSSEESIDGDNEQIIPEWGVSVQIHQEKYYFPSGSGNITARTTDMIESSITFKDSSKRWLAGVPDNDAYFPTNWIRSGDYTPDCDPGSSGFEGLPNGPVYLNPCNYPDDAGADPGQKYESILEGTVAPHRLTGYQADYMPLAYFGTFNGSSRQNASISFLPSVNIVITSDKSKWTRCPVVELGRTAALNVGGSAPGGLRKSPSVDKNGNSDGTGTGMGWFPGYAVDLESGARLYLAFGENSFLGGENGADMVWNPTDKFISNVGTPLMGGMHPIYVFSYNQKTINAYNSSFDFPAYIPSQAESNGGNVAYQKYVEVETNSAQAKRDLYGSLTWISYPLLTPGQSLLATDVTIKLRINKEYKNYTATGQNNGRPMYGWSMDDIATQVGAQDALKEVLSTINVVPNPYYAFSDYERTKLENKIKITNLPERCTISIFNAQGKRLKQFKKDSPITYQDWNLCNEANIPVSGGTYLILVEVPGVGEVVLKAFIVMRTPDLENL